MWLRIFHCSLCSSESISQSSWSRLHSATRGTLWNKYRQRGENILSLVLTTLQWKDGDLLADGRIRYVTSNGWDLSQLEAPELILPEDFKPPYDAIHVGAAAESLPPSLLNALKV
jgi:hypothetical protein